MGEAIGYARVSTVGQDLTTQIEQLEGARVEKIFQEKASGANANRPVLNEMLNYVRSGDTLCVTKIDRIARSTKHLLEVVDTLEVKGVTFKVLNINLDTSTPTGKLMMTMLGAIATFERELMLERQLEGIQRAKREGKYKGRKPTARAKAAEIIALANQGLKRQEIADRVGVGVASVYRVLKFSPSSLIASQ